MNMSLFALLLLICLFLATAVSPSALQSESNNGNDFRLARGEKETRSVRNNNVQKQDGDEGDKINEDIKKSGGGHGRGAGGGAGGNGNHHGLNRRKNGASTRSGPLNFALILSFVCAYILSACPVR